MRELSKEDIKEVFVETLEPFAKSVQQDFKGVNERLDKVETRLTGVETRLTGVENQWEQFQKNASELFTKLDEFISLYKKQESELLSLTSQMSRLEKRVEKLEAKSLYTQ